MTRRRRPEVGNVVQFELLDRTCAYGRVLRDASVAFYRTTTDGPGEPPIGSRDFEFTVGVYEDVLRAAEIVGHDPSATELEDWPPPYSVRDPIGGGYEVYERGELRSATANECLGLEPAAVWDLPHILERFASRGGP